MQSLKTGARKNDTWFFPYFSVALPSRWSWKPHERPFPSAVLQWQMTGQLWRYGWTFKVFAFPMNFRPLFVSAWIKASYQPGCCSLQLAGSALQILLWAKQVQLFFFFQIDYPNYSLYYMKPKEKMKCTNSWPPASCSSIIRNYKLMLVVLCCSLGWFMSLCSQCWWNKLNWAWKRNKDLLSIWKPGFNVSWKSVANIP